MSQLTASVSATFPTSTQRGIGALERAELLANFGGNRPCRPLTERRKTLTADGVSASTVDRQRGQPVDQVTEFLLRVVASVGLEALR